MGWGSGSIGFGINRVLGKLGLGFGLDRARVVGL